MTYSVYQHWDPLKVCIVGRSYPPEFYNWIKIPHVRSLFEKIATETEEDYQNIIKKLNEFGVEVLRPDLPVQPINHTQFLPPPMTPRDHMIMVGSTFYESVSFDLELAYNQIRDASWPDCYTWSDFEKLPAHIIKECVETHGLIQGAGPYSAYSKIVEHIRNQGNCIKSLHHKSSQLNLHSDIINGAMIARLGKDLFFGTRSYTQDIELLQKNIDQEFTATRNHVINTGGHADGTYCPVCPGLIISLHDVPTYAETFPGWEVVYLPNQSWELVKEFRDLKTKNQGRWWIPGFESDQDVVDVVETWLKHWTGYVEETVFDVNMLIIDPKNVIVFNYNQQVFDAFDRYGITAHVIPFRHRYFWDGGIHCVTSDLHRQGSMQDFFTDRKDPKTT